MRKEFEVFLGDGSKGIRSELEKASSLLSGVKFGYETAVMRSLNRSAITGRSEMVKATRKRYTVKAKPVREAIRIEEKATVDSLETILRVRSRRIAVEQFKFTPKTDTTGNTRKPVRVAVIKGRSPKALKNAFVFKGRIYQRTDTTSTPLVTKTGPSAPSMVGSATVSDSVHESMKTTFLKRLDHEVREVLRSGVNGRNGGKIHGRE